MGDEAEKAVAAGELPPAAPAAAMELKISHQAPTMIYNAMINPIVGYGIRGAIWYQGESNGKEGESYFHKMQALFGSLPQGVPAYPA